MRKHKGISNKNNKPRSTRRNTEEEEEKYQDSVSSVVKFLALGHPQCCRIVGGEIHIAVKALPGASKTEFAGVKEQRLRMRIAAAAEDGKANAELIAFIATQLGCPKKEVRLLRGTQSRIKTIAVPLAYRVQLETILAEVQE